MIFSDHFTEKLTAFDFTLNLFSQVENHFDSKGFLEGRHDGMA
jgi:hypothetical protein